jgi:hypothetical protein
MSEFLDNYLSTFEDLPALDMNTATQNDTLDKGELSRLDKTVLEYVHKNYPALVVDDLGEFVLGFCNEYPYRASLALERLEFLRTRGFK